MHILVINSGSSSLKFSLYNSASQAIPPSTPPADPSSVLEGELSGVGSDHTSLKLQPAGQPAQTRPEPNAGSPTDAARLIFDLISKPGTPSIDAIGYRVVHPGPHLVGHQRITPQIFDELEHAITFAPLHDPAVLEVIRVAMDRFPNLPHFACFDTEFHRTMPPEASVYAIPKHFRDQGVRRYGFHGLSCESIIHQLQQTGQPIPSRMVLAHLGSGCSITATRDGRSIDTSMGLTPDGGVVMGTRPGDLDPGLVLYLLRQQNTDTQATISSVESLLNRNSGMVALSGLENNMLTTRKAAAIGNADALLALQVFTRAITKTIGGYAWLLGGLDAIVFTGGIGEHDSETRAQVLAGLDPLGISINSSLNSASRDDLRTISASQSQTAIMVIPARENLIIAMHVDRMANSTN